MEYLLPILVITGIYIILSLSLNLILGYTGLPAFGHAVFLCIGILLVEQNAQMTLEIAHRGYVFKIGEIVLADSGKSLMGNEEVKKAFLGG